MITGRYYNGETNLDDVLAMKFAAADGSVLWMRTFDGPAHLDDRGWNLVIGPDDDPTITGMMPTSAADASYFTARLRSSDGATLWARLLPGAINNPDDRCGWLATAGAGDVILVNKIWLADLSYEVFLHRFAASDGEPVWHHVIGSEGAVADEPRTALKLSSGDIAVAGTRSGDYLVLRIRAADGSVAWSSGYDGPPGWYDSADCLAEGPQGEVIVGGFSSGTTTGWDAVTQAFDPNDGAALWNLRFDAGDAQTEEASALAVSPLGDLYVAGYAYTNATYSDLMTLRYTLDVAPSAAELVAPPTSALEVEPNPSRGATRLRISMPGATRAQVGIYDVSGRRRAGLGEVALTAGSARLDWDGRGEDGRFLPPGIYLARVRTSVGSSAQRIVRLP